MNALIYCRVSTNELADEGYMDEQERALRTYCNNKGYEVVDVYKDKRSDSFHSQMRMRRLYDYCKEHMDSINKILFLRWDRFSRNVEHIFQYKEKFEEIGVEINAIDSPIDFTSSDWPIFLGIHCGMAHFEDVMKSKRIRMGMRHAALKRNDQLSVNNDL